MKEVWNPPKMKAIRRLHLREDFEKIPSCKDYIAYQDLYPKLRTKAYLSYLTLRLYGDTLELKA